LAAFREVADQRLAADSSEWKVRGVTFPSVSDDSSPIDRDALESLRSGLELLAVRAFGDRAIAEEVAQDALARAVVAAERGTLVRPGGTAAFVAGIARHIIADRRRAAAREAPLSAADGVPASEIDPLERLLASDEAARVRAALASLDPADRELLRLSYYEGRAPAEIAAMTGEPSERIRKRKSRALERVREALEQARDGHVAPRAPTERVQKHLDSQDQP
jgi:RNA polymerase sigma-70 factor (ECF subfamily)